MLSSMKIVYTIDEILHSRREIMLSSRRLALSLVAIAHLVSRIFLLKFIHQVFLQALFLPQRICL